MIGLIRREACGVSARGWWINFYTGKLRRAS